MPTRSITDILCEDYTSRLFPPQRQLIPNLDDVYELELAFYENQILSDSELISNGAYFAKVRQSYTRHFLMCTGSSLKLARHSSSRLKSFFAKNIFRTGYATHGLFPYRGKFHPQMIKALMNVMGLKPGDRVLDPMMGSGTVPVEAVLMGMDALGFDASPFCKFMAQTKIDALTMPLERARRAFENRDEVFDYFADRVGRGIPGSKARVQQKPGSFMSVMEETANYAAKRDSDKLSARKKSSVETYNFLLLAYLDSVGYSERSKRATPREQFAAILERYLFVAEKIQNVFEGMERDFGTAEILQADARDMPTEDESVDGVIFSPPYSFAIDYLENDSFHLKFLGANTEKLREQMVGLRGRGLAQKFEWYIEDMGRIFAECARVLRKGRICTIVIGTNSNQLSKVLGVRPEAVKGLHEILAEQAASHGLVQLKTIDRPITGIANTMRREFIVLLQRE